jgi:hypothetical protein
VEKVEQLREVERFVYMSETTGEITLKVSASDVSKLRCALAVCMEEEVRDDGSLDVRYAELYAMLEPHYDRLKLQEEQQDVDRRIKELEERRNALRA